MLKDYRQSAKGENLEEIMRSFQSGEAFKGPIYRPLTSDFGTCEVHLSDENYKENAKYLTST